MRTSKSFLLGILLGVVACYLTVEWRIGAATAFAQLYAVGAIEANQELQQCRASASPWPKRRGLQ